MVIRMMSGEKEEGMEGGREEGSGEEGEGKMGRQRGREEPTVSFSFPRNKPVQGPPLRQQPCWD